MIEIIHNTKNLCLTMLMYIFRLFPIDNKKIVFISFFGKGYNDNPMLISEKLEEEDIKIIWATDRGVKCSSHVKQVYVRSIRYMYELATAKVWVDNARKYMWAKKRRKQFYLQTWHGPVCIKAVEKDAESTLPREYVKRAIQDSKNVNVIVSESKWRSNNIREAFWYNGEIIEAEFKRKRKSLSSMDRNVRQYFGLDQNDKIVLYVPTFRTDGDLTAYCLDYKRLLNQLQINGEVWRIIVRLHPNVSKNASSLQYSDEVLNGTLYPDINDLTETANIVITDYSGVIFEAYRASKIVLLFATDIEHYVQAERKLYFDFNALPSPLAHNNDELIHNLKYFDKQKYEHDRELFVEKLGYFEKDATIECVNRIKKEMGISLK